MFLDINLHYLGGIIYWRTLEMVNAICKISAVVRISKEIISHFCKLNNLRLKKDYLRRTSLMEVYSVIKFLCWYLHYYNYPEVMLHRRQMTFMRKELNSKTLILATVSDTANIHEDYQFRAEPVQTWQAVYEFKSNSRLSLPKISGKNNCVHLKGQNHKTLKRPKP